MFKEFLTLEGERLLAQAMSGDSKITFTKMEIGDGDHGTDNTITSLKNPRMTIDIYSVQISGDNQIIITNLLESTYITEPFYFREKGLYATDGEKEILFAYGTSGSGAEYIQNSNSSYFKRTIKTIVTFSNSGEINVTVQSGLYATPEDIERVLDAIEGIKLEGDWSTYTQVDNLINMFDIFSEMWNQTKALFLDASISSRAPAATSLSNTVWTDDRAGKIDKIDKLDKELGYKWKNKI